MDGLLSYWGLVDLILSILLCYASFQPEWTRSIALWVLLPRPPGPPVKNWVLGNLSDMPLKSHWLTFAEWAKRYGNTTPLNVAGLLRKASGGLVYLRILHTHVLVINSLDVAIELFETRSNTYSSRKALTMVEMYVFIKYFGPSFTDPA